MNILPFPIVFHVIFKMLEIHSICRFELDFLYEIKLTSMIHIKLSLCLIECLIPDRKHSSSHGTSI